MKAKPSRKARKIAEVGDTDTTWSCCISSCAIRAARSTRRGRCLHVRRGIRRDVRRDLGVATACSWRAAWLAALQSARPEHRVTRTDRGTPRAINAQSGTTWPPVTSVTSSVREFVMKSAFASVATAAAIGVGLLTLGSPQRLLHDHHHDLSAERRHRLRDQLQRQRREHELGRMLQARRRSLAVITATTSFRKMWITAPLGRHRRRHFWGEREEPLDGGPL